MTHYLNFAVKDFTTDDYFIKWVLDNDAATNLEWENWIKINSGKAPEVKEAKLLVQAFHEAQQAADTIQINKVYYAFLWYFANRRCKANLENSI